SPPAAGLAPAVGRALVAAIQEGRGREQGAVARLRGVVAIDPERVHVADRLRPMPNRVAGRLGIEGLADRRFFAQPRAHARDHLLGNCAAGVEVDGHGEPPSADPFSPWERVRVRAARVPARCGYSGSPHPNPLPGGEGISRRRFPMAIDLNTSSTITEEMVARVRARLGEESPISEPFNTEATRDTIRHWAEAIGDVNPLWIDRDYAAKTRYGTLLAPPSFLYSCNQGPAHRGRQAGGWRGFAGIHRVWVGEEWEWHQPIQLGDQIRGTTK